jgi:hypothetical protein
MKIEIEIKIPEVVGSNPHETLPCLVVLSCFDFFFNHPNHKAFPSPFQIDLISDGF